MSREQIEIGNKWVEEMLNLYATEFKVPLNQMEWGEGKGDFENDQFSLAYYVNEKRYIEKFSLADLEDVANDNSVRAKLETRLEKLVDPFLYKPRTIGF